MKPQNTVPANFVLNRRHWLATGAAAVCGGLLEDPGQGAPSGEGARKSFRFALNTGTIRGQNLPLDQELEVAVKAGYDGMEPWMEKVQRYAQNGGSLKDLGRRAADAGLTIESAIGFPSWAVDDESQRAKGFEQAKRDMDLLAQLGAKRMAAPPAGIPQGQRVEPERVAERYRQLLEMGDRIGVQPLLEFWGKNPTLGKLSTAAAIAIETGHPKACIVADVFHMYRGGSPFEGLRLLSGSAVPVLHLNDYPADPARDQANDSHRLMPGDGIAPLPEILRGLRGSGALPVVSLELFNRDYWKQDALEVARLGLRKMKAAVAAAG